MLGFSTFHLEFHLAHLILRQTETASTCADSSTTSSESLVDLSFLQLESSSGKTAPHSIYQAHDSVVFCGWSNAQWTGYVFTNTGHNALPYADEEDEEIPGALDIDYGFDFDLGRKIWDAREYWLRIVAFRCQLVWREWFYLVRTVEEAIETWVGHIFTTSRRQLTENIRVCVIHATITLPKTT